MAAPWTDEAYLRSVWIVPDVTPEQPFDFEQEDPLALARGLWSALKIMAVLWGMAVAAFLWFK